MRRYLADRLARPKLELGDLETVEEPIATESRIIRAHHD